MSALLASASASICANVIGLAARMASNTREYMNPPMGRKRPETQAQYAYVND
jgi:disulfide oxidoreductase YuzD